MKKLLIIPSVLLSLSQAYAQDSTVVETDSNKRDDLSSDDEKEKDDQFLNLKVNYNKITNQRNNR